MKKAIQFIICFIILWLCAVSAQAGTLSIQSATLSGWQDSRTAELWVFSDSSWTDANGNGHGGGSPSDKVFTQRVTGLTNNTSTKTLTIPAFSLVSTSDALVNPNVRYFFWIMAIVGTSSTPVKMYPNAENGIKAPATIVSISGCSPAGTCATFYDLIVYSQGAQPTPIPRFTYSDAQIDAKLAGLALGGGNVSSNASVSVDAQVALFSGTTGKLLRPATGPALFIASPAADPGQGDTTTVNMMKGADSSSGSPLASVNPSTYFQTIRTGGSHSQAMFGYLSNFQLVGASSYADTYANYDLSRVSPNMASNPGGAYFHLARRSYIILNPSNIGAAQVVGYGFWAEGETQVSGVSVYGAQLDSNNMSGVDASAEDFSSLFKVANIATNYTSNANASAIIYSQGARGASAYQGWKVSPNAVIRHILDFKDAYYTISGTIAVTNGSGAIVGTGTKFLTDLVKGDQLQPGGVVYTVTAIADDTHATISPVYAGSTASGLQVAKYVTPLRMASDSYITVENAGGSDEVRAFGMKDGVFRFAPDGTATVFSGIVQVPSPLQLGGNTSAEIAVKRSGTQGQLRLGDDSGWGSWASGYFTEAEQNATLANGDNNDLAVGTVGILRITGPSGAFAITGFANGAAGRILTIYNLTNQQMTIKSDNANSTAANRIYTLNGSNNDVVFSAYGSATFKYSALDSRWILINRT